MFSTKNYQDFTNLFLLIAIKISDVHLVALVLSDVVAAMGLFRGSTWRFQWTVITSDTIYDGHIFNCFVLFALFAFRYSLAKIGAKAIQRVHNTSYLIGSVPDLLTLASGISKFKYDSLRWIPSNCVDLNVGTSQDWAKGVAGVNYSYTIEIRGAGERGMILPAKQIVPTSEETWAGTVHTFSPLFRI